MKLIRRHGSLIFLLASMLVVGLFVYLSGQLVDDLAKQERARMEIWADATKEIATLGTGDAMADVNIEFLLSILEANENIPVVLTDSRGEIIQQRNFSLPDRDGDIASQRNLDYLYSRLKSLDAAGHRIDIKIDDSHTQHLYYDDSTLLTRLSWYPYLQLVVMAAFVLVVYLAVTSSKRAEQNKVWVGLSKETAHQLGTPISSLMAWVELMRQSDVDPMMVEEMDKDIKRLSTIASRFSKIGSQPTIEPADLNDVVARAAAYMGRRISSRIKLTVVPAGQPLLCNMSEPLIEWVMENLIKNAVDAMDGAGSITIVLERRMQLAVVDVTDTGKGMTRKMRKEVFRPGFTTKKRGWGLGLTLARRIIEEYHGGKIWVSASEPQHGTTFKIQLPLCENHTEQ